ncbi:hypothetical protein P9112_010339 [Eukaryota sp. TZLM1-RC]
MSSSKADGLFVDEDYTGAIDAYTNDINSSGPSSTLLSRRAAAYIKLGNFESALNDCDSSLQLNSTIAITHYRKGIALFMLQKHTDAFHSFVKAEELSCIANVSSWKRRCKAYVKDLVEQKPQPDQSKTQPIPQPTKADRSEPPKAPTTSDKPTQPPKIRHEWLQTSQMVTIEIFAPKINKDSVKVEATPNTAEITFPLPSGSDYMLDLELYGSIDPSSVEVRTTPRKVEIVMRKDPQMRWKTLEKGEQVETLDPKLYPSSKGAKNWTKIAKEEAEKYAEEDKKSEDFLSQIFSQGDPDTQRAMQKSFLESGGTVLSTNWSEVGKEKVEPYKSKYDDE